jgi:hypothetical protein
MINGSGTTRESPPAFGALAPGARDRAKTAGATAVARGRRLPLDTWYRRRKRAQDAAAVAYARAAFERAEAFAAVLARDLDRCAALQRETAAIIAELAALPARGTRQAMV